MPAVHTHRDNPRQAESQCVHGALSRLARSRLYPPPLGRVSVLWARVKGPHLVLQGRREHACSHSQLPGKAPNVFV